jgi:peptidoglycan/LPS O-acetylase OafA/YrhL
MISARKGAGEDVRAATGGHRNDIQGLRAVAVLLVVLNHAGVGFLTGGFVGVDVFFVLSGFLITGLLLRGATERGFVSISEFYVRRARRILPAATLTLIVTNLAAYYLLNFVRAKQFLQDSIYAALFGANFHFSSQGTDYFARAQPPSPVQHFWSLSVEEQFYLVWPGLLALVLFGVVLKRRYSDRTSEVTNRGLRRLLAVVTLAAVASLGWSIYYTPAHPTSAYFSTLTRVWELGLGAALAVGASTIHEIPRRARTATGWLGLIGIIAAGVMFSSSTEFPGYAVLLPTLATAMVIGAGLGEQSRRAASRVLAIRPMRYVGDRSYTFYLWHWPALTIAALYEGRHLSTTTNLLLLAGAFLLSIVTYGLFENPLRKMTWRPPKAALVLWPASILAVLVVAEWGIHAIDTKETLAASAGGPLYPGLSADPVSSANGEQPGKRGRHAARAPGNAAAVNGTLPAVITSVKAAQQGAPIPARLNPPVGRLLNDHQDLPAGCTPQDAQSASRICRLGDPSGKRSIVVMGDSHAEMWMPAILDMAKRDGWVVLPVVKSACTPADWWIARYGSARCHAWYAWAVRQVKNLHPDVTLVTGHFTTLGTEHTASAEGLGSLASALKQASKRVVLLGDLPELAQQPVDCLLARNATMATCATTPSPDQLSADADIATGAVDAHLGFMDPTGWFCSSELCPTVIGHTIAYFDTNHVSSTYALELASVFRAAFQRATRHSAGGHA